LSPCHLVIVLPLNAQGYVIGEYTRRQANRYLDDTIAPFFNAIEPVFIPHYLPHWRVKIVCKLSHCDPFILGVMNVDAATGAPTSSLCAFFGLMF